MKHNTTSAYRASANGAFTLVELLIVIAIMAVVVVIAIGVGKYVLGESSQKNTETAQSIIKSAISVYHDKFGAYPPDGGAGLPYDGNEDLESTRVLLSHLENCKESWAKISTLNSDIFTSTTDYLRDGWGSPMIYDMDGGIGGTPVIISAGPDTDPETESDNIRSDKH